MTVATTSKTAYTKLKSVGQLGRDERQVYEQIKFMESQASNESALPSRRDIANMLGMETSSVSGRVNALIRYGLIGELKGKKRDKTTNMTVSVLHVVDRNDNKLVKMFKSIDDDTDKFGHSFGVANG